MIKCRKNKLFHINMMINTDFFSWSDLRIPVGGGAPLWLGNSAVGVEKVQRETEWP
jgi:hypothetical protein